MLHPEDLSTVSDIAAAAPENATQAEPQATQSESPQPTAGKNSGAAEAADDNAGNNAKPRANAQERRRSGKGSRAAGSDNKPADHPRSLEEQLLTPLHDDTKRRIVTRKRTPHEVGIVGWGCNSGRKHWFYDYFPCCRIRCFSREKVPPQSA